MPTVSPDDPQAPHVCRVWYCFLCLERLPYQASSLRPQWRDELISLFPCTASDGSVRAILETTDVDSVWDEPQKQRWATDALGSKHLVRFCDNASDPAMLCAQGDPGRVIFYAHRCCWKVANVPVLNDPLVLLRFAFHMRQFEKWPLYHQSQEFHAQYDPSAEPPPPLFDLSSHELLPFDIRFFNGATELGRLVSKLSNVPLEIQFQVTKRLDVTLFLSLLRAKTLITQLLPQIRQSTTMKPETHVPDTDGTFNRIYVRYRDIMGKPYLADISFRGDGGGEASSISVSGRQVRGVQFSLGRFGLRGIRVMYLHDTFSPWLGVSSSCWIGVARGRDLSRLRVIADALRVVRIYFLNSSLERTPAMWYGPFSPPENMVNRLFPPPYRQGRGCVRQLEYYPGWRQCRYLALSTPSGYTSGLTVYLDHTLEYLIGIAAHGHSNLQLGRPKGVQIHLSLNKGEHLTSAWLHVRGFNYGRLDCLSVTTNHGRVRHFGNYQNVRQHRCKPQPRGYDTPCRWIRISDDRPARIDGIFIDANDYLRSGEVINAIGVSQKDVFSQAESGTDVLGPTYLEVPPSTTALPEPPFSLFTQKYGFFYSTASLSNIHKVQVRKHNGRCLGMHLLYEDLTVETLGQWDPRDRDSILTVYDAPDGILLRLIFHTRLENNCLMKPQIHLISAEVSANSWQPQLPVEATSDDANSRDPEAASTGMDEHGASCHNCGSPKCCDSTLRGERTVQTFNCSQPGQRIVWYSGAQYDTVCLDDILPQIKVKPASNVRVDWPPSRSSGKDSSMPPVVILG